MSILFVKTPAIKTQLNGLRLNILDEDCGEFEKYTGTIELDKQSR